MRKKVEVQSIEQRLLEVDRLIANVAESGCEKIRRCAPVSEIDADVEFLRKLYGRRDTIIWELKKAGITEGQAYSHLRTWQDGVLHR